MTINRIVGLLNPRCRCQFCTAAREFDRTVKVFREIEQCTELLDWHVPNPEQIAAGNRRVAVCVYFSMDAGEIGDDFRTSTARAFRDLAAKLLTDAAALESPEMPS